MRLVGDRHVVQEGLGGGWGFVRWVGFKAQILFGKARISMKSVDGSPACLESEVCVFICWDM